MAEIGRAGGPQPPAGPSREQLEERWKEAVDVLNKLSGAVGQPNGCRHSDIAHW